MSGARKLTHKQAWPYGGGVEFGDTVADFTKLGDILLAQLNDGRLYISIDGERWERFVIKIIGDK